MPNRLAIARVLIPENIPSLNKGEEAILRGIQRVVGMVGDAEFALFSSSPDADQKHYPDVRVVDTRSQVPLQGNMVTVSRMVTFVLWAIAERMVGGGTKNSTPQSLVDYYAWSDLIILGHDDTLCGSRFPLRVVRDVIVARLLRKPVMVFGGSFVLPKHRISRLMAKWAFQRMDAVTLRERSSMRELEQLGIAPRRVRVSADPAFLLEPNPVATLPSHLQEIVTNRQTPLIGMTAVQGSAVFEHAFCKTDFAGSREARHKQHVRALASAIDQVIEATEATVVFLPHCIGPTARLDDRRVAADIYRTSRYPSHLILLEDDLPAADLKALIGQLDLLVGERTHSVIQAVSMGIPSLAISFPQDNRTHGIIGEMLGQHRWLYDIERLEAGPLAAHILELWSERHRVAQELLERLPAVRDRAMEESVWVSEILAEYGYLQVSNEQP